MATTSEIKLRSVNTHFWDDVYINTLDPIEKLMFLYFLTNPLTNLAGVYEISIRRIAFDTGIDQEMVLKILERFSKKGNIFYRDGFIIMPNFEYNQKFNASMKIHVQKILNGLPKQILEFFNKIKGDKHHVNTMSTPSVQVEDKVEDKVEGENPIIVKFGQFFPSKFIDNGFEKHWMDWINFNEERNSPITAIQAKKQLEYLAGLDNPVEQIEKCIRNNWKGLEYKPDKEDKRRDKDLDKF